MEDLTLRRTWKTCPGGTPPIYFGGREHCFDMSASGFQGLRGPGLSGSLGMGNLISLAAVAVVGGIAYAHFSKKGRRRRR
jgi:hypothetical protein